MWVEQACVLEMQALVVFILIEWNITKEGYTSLYIEDNMPLIQ